MAFILLGAGAGAEVQGLASNAADARHQGQTMGAVAGHFRRAGRRTAVPAPA